jgi:hypothetical protein
MPENEPYQNAPHLQSRLAVPEGSHPPRIGLHEHLAASALEQHIRDGDLGAARSLIHEAEYLLGPLRPDPWRLLEHLADRAITRLSGGVSEALGAGDGVNVSPQPGSDTAAGSEGGERDPRPPSPASTRPAPAPAPGPGAAGRAADG